MLPTLDIHHSSATALQKMVMPRNKIVYPVDASHPLKSVN